MTSHVPRVAAAASRRAVLRGLTSAASALALCGCAGMAAGPRFDASALVLNPTLLVASTRKPVNGARAKPWFGTERGKMTVARATLTPPDDGRFSLASVGLADWNLEKIEPVAQIGDLIDPTAGGHDVLIYVHGYNTTFETAALDAARLSDGVKFVGETMVFSWPSRAGLLDYGYDRESAMWSRDALQQLLDGLIASPIVGHVHIVAHSIGTMLTMEALRQHGKMQMGEIARRLGMSKRTLARRLSSYGLTFAGILADLRVALGKRHLTDEDLAISQIAWLLGYQEVSAFTHAFKRKTGKTPKEVRSKQV
jgi:AraC-like DNA-binding protein